MQKVHADTMTSPPHLPSPRQAAEDLLASFMRREAEARTADDSLVLAEDLAAAVALYPGDHRLLANWGNALWLADQVEAALAPYKAAVQLAPAEALLYRGLCNVLTDLQAFEAAANAYALSSRLRADPLTSWNHGQVLIGLERYTEGYGLAECRWDLPGVTPWRDPCASGRAAGAGPLLVWSEQGLGDILQHLRWLGPLVAMRGPEAPAVVLEVEACLVELLRVALGQLVPRPEVRAKPRHASSAPGWGGAHVSLLSLPALLGGAPIPPQACWLAGEHWSQPTRSRRIGLVWAAGRKLDNPVGAREYRRRSLDAAALHTLIGGIRELGYHCVLLQFGDDRELAEPWRQQGVEELPDGADFAATAELVAGLELVISVDTAMAHLVGAMRREGWVLLPFSAAPRWLRQREDSPWYPSVRLFRQRQPGQWLPVVADVLEALAARRSSLDGSVAAVPEHGGVGQISSGSAAGRRESSSHF
jgi:hypothetical protein